MHRSPVIFFFQTSSDDFFSGDPFKSTSSHTSLSKSTNSSKDPFQSTDFFGSNDLFDGRAANSSTDGNKTSESDSFSNGKSDPFKPTAKGSDDPFTASFASFPEQSKQKHGKVALRFILSYILCLLVSSCLDLSCSLTNPISFLNLLYKEVLNFLSINFDVKF